MSRARLTTVVSSVQPPLAASSARISRRETSPSSWSTRVSRSMFSPACAIVTPIVGASHIARQSPRGRLSAGAPALGHVQLRMRRLCLPSSILAGRHVDGASHGVCLGESLRDALSQSENSINAKMRGSPCLRIPRSCSKAEAFADALSQSSEGSTGSAACGASRRGRWWARRSCRARSARSCRINLAYRDDRRYMSAYQLATTGNIMSTTFLYQDVQTSSTRLTTWTFNSSADHPVRRGERRGCLASQPTSRWTAFPKRTDYLRASASLPMVSQIVEVQGRRYLDGGTCDSVPVEQALRQEGTARAVVVLTQDRAYAKKPVSTPGACARSTGDYPYYLEALLTRPERYNAQRSASGSWSARIHRGHRARAARGGGQHGALTAPSCSTSTSKAATSPARRWRTSRPSWGR